MNRCWIPSIAFALACGPKEAPPVAAAAAAPAADAAAGLRAEADAAWEQRGDKAQLQAALTRYAQLHAAAPQDREVLVRLTRGYYFLGDAHESEKDTKLATWQTAMDWGQKCVQLNADYTALLSKGNETDETAARVATKDDVPCLYWTATALGKWSKLNGISKSLKNLPTVKAYIAKVAELQPDYFHGAADRYWGAYYAAIPSFAGQDLNKSKEHFDKSIAMAPDYLGTKVLMAENWSVKKQDRPSYESLLNQVIAADAAKIPEITPEMQAEQAKAKELLAQADELFR